MFRIGCRFGWIPSLRSLLAVAFTATLLPALATVRYVDNTSGADSGDALSAPGWKTLAYAVSTADAGDEIILAKGTHVIASDITIGKKLDIHGAGEMDETILDANHVKYTITISAEGAKISKLQFYRLGGYSYHQGFVVLSGNSTIADCRFTGCGYEKSQYSFTIVKASAGLISRCYFTENRGDGSLGIHFPSGNAVVQNCVFMNNVITSGGLSGKGFLYFNTNNAIARNCTIVNNTMCADGAVYAGAWTSAEGFVDGRLYNCIVYNNCDSSGAQKNWYTRGLSNKSTCKWIGNCMYPLKGTGSTTGSAANNVEDDPQLDSEGKPTLSTPATVKTGASVGTDYLAATDILGVSRGTTPSRGAYQYVPESGLSVVVEASPTEVRLPATIALSTQVEDAQGDLTYAWDYNNDGTTDSTEATPKLATVGTYDSVKVTVSDGTTSKDAYYNGTLTVLPRYMTNVVVSADKKAVRTPGTITFSATVGDDDAVGPFVYSWDLDGDGVEDSTAEHPVLSTVGSYENPTLLKLTDANGLYSDKVVLTGTYSILPAEPQTITVNVGDSVATAIASAFDGDTVVIKKGTHTFTDNVVIDRPITIRGEGENNETILDANHTAKSTSLPHLKITADGAFINNLTFYRLCGGGYHNGGLFRVTGNSVVSNCVFTGGGVDANDNKLLIDMANGTLTSCWITNNLCRYAPLVQIQGVTNTLCENCVIADNRVTTGNASACYGLFNVRTGLSIVRNCTVANNCTGTKDYCGLSIHYQSGAANAGTHCKIYNTIVWGNTNSAGAVRNVCTRRWYADNFFFNNTSAKMLGDDYVEYDLNSHSGGYAGRECVTIDPAFDAQFGLTGSAGATLKTGAKTGTDKQSVAYCTDYDIYGNLRGDKPSMGAVQYVASSSLSAAINADKTTARPPAEIVLKAVVEGAASENLTYAWDIDGDGEFDDGTDSTNILSKAGTYDAVSVRVSDGTGTVTATYDGALTVYLDVTVSADQPKVRQPGVITFSAAVADEMTAPFTYSWDLNGDGVEDSTAANPTLSAIGDYTNPTLLRLTDANGLVSDKIVLTGTYTVLPEKARTITVNAGESIVDALAGAYDGDEIVLGVGTHPVTSVIQVSRPITICGAGKKEETILDANYGGAKSNNYWHVDLLSAGAKICNLTFDRFGCIKSGYSGFVKIAADAVVSNVVVRNGYCGWNQGNFVQLSAGLLTHCWITNNVAGNCAGVQMSGNSTVQDCAILDNRSTSSTDYAGAALSMPSGSGTQTVRNCTIAFNTFVYTNNTAVYGRAWDSTAQWIRLYNNIVWSNTCTQTGALHPNAHNEAGQKWFVKNNCWDYNLSSKLRDPDGGTDIGSVLADPKFDAVKGAPWLSDDSPCRNKGADAYAPTGLDLIGNPRKGGRHVDIGAVEIPAKGLMIIVR